MRLKEAAIGNTQRENVHYRTPSGGNRAGDLFEDRRRRAHHKPTPAEQIASGQAPMPGFGFTTPPPAEMNAPRGARPQDPRVITDDDRRGEDAQDWERWREAAQERPKKKLPKIERDIERDPIDSLIQDGIEFKTQVTDTGMTQIRFRRGRFRWGSWRNWAQNVD